MCDLLGVSSRHPVAIEMSFRKLLERAKTVNPHGWGTVYYAGSDAYVFREPRPGSDSQLANILSHCGITSQLVISHIRKATSGEIALKNTHPFTREIDGKLHSFAFNGDIPSVFALHLETKRFQPIGNSDAEHAYCWLLNQLVKDKGKNDAQHKAQMLHAFGSQLSEMGPANFLYSDSHRLYAFASRRRHPDGEYPPGLYLLNRQCDQHTTSIPCVGLNIETSSSIPQEITLVASIPLSDEDWIPFQENELVILENGQKISSKIDTDL